MIGTVKKKFCTAGNGTKLSYDQPVFIDGIMDKYRYINILAENLEDSAKKLGLNDYYFQQDNVPKHTAKEVKEFLKIKDIKLIDWPSQSPDLNPIEHLWAHVKNKLSEKRPKNINQLKQNILEIWSSITQEFT